MGEGASFSWVEEYKGKQYVSVGTKRKSRTKKLEYDGWGSKPLIEFLESIGVDTSKQISRYDVASIVQNYVNDNNLLHPVKKKRISCDGRLLSLFVKKTISRIKVYDLLEIHYKENQVDSDSDFHFSSEEEDNANKVKVSNSERKVQGKPKVKKAPKTAFAAIVPENIKRVYLKKSLVQDLVKDLESFESKIVGSFVKIKSDPFDYLQKNPYMLVQVTGLKKVAGAIDNSEEILLMVSNYMNDVKISMLSDKNFSEEECEDLHNRMQDGSLHKLTVGELDEKVKVLHEDVTKHWLMEELALLEQQIEQANLKGWRRELSEYLDRKRLLQTPAEQSRLLNEIPEVIAEEIKVDATPQDDLDNMENGNYDPPKSTAGESFKLPVENEEPTKASSAGDPCCTNSAENQATLLISKQSNGTDNCNFAFDEEYIEKQQCCGSESMAVRSEEHNRSEGIVDVQKEQPLESHPLNGGKIQPVISKENNLPSCMVNLQVIDLCDDEEDDDKIDSLEIIDYDLESFVWYYSDPQGNTQGPFCIAALKRWNDANYFPPDFKVWKLGRSMKDAVLLRDILKIFPAQV